ncbi:hypothetical protein PCASD_00124 [Puccinia coronata f. sp. avenae]|uniref:Ubiquitin-like domain-containing protein n=1 Tax=Puccinia coronata f. sp. avenae TaxID=200324 RepID=A0A2N5SD71_9BASI|nr:hypothetical protein PCASD_21607 [Puccinia coronata f. sp. avenae]PLW52446.1 hypothetical protein PCASD_00124 [Puccinia coronata f. sp. avenae]
MSQSPPQEDCMIPKSNSLCNRNQFLLPFIHRELKKLAVSDGSEPLILRVKTTTPFQKIYNAVAQQKGVEPRSFRLQYDGQRLLPNDSTPADLNLENDDALDYYVEQVGGSLDPQESLKQNIAGREGRIMWS